MRTALKIIGILFAIGVLLAVVFPADEEPAAPSDEVATEQSEPEAETEPRYDEDSPEYQLALIDDRASSPSDEDGIRPYARELDLLERRCTNARSRLADFTVNTVKQAEKRNVSTNNRNVLGKVRRSFPPGWKRQGCTGVFALYLTILVES